MKMARQTINEKILTTKVIAQNSQQERRTLSYIHPYGESVPRLILHNPKEDKPISTYFSRNQQPTYTTEEIIQALSPLQRELNESRTKDSQFKEKLNSTLQNYGWNPQELE